MDISFAHRKVIVTGAGMGLGRAIAQAFAADGAAVWATDINNEGLQETKRLAAGTLNAHPLDLRDRNAVQTFVADAAQGGPIDVLVNCAGGVCGQAGQPLESVTAQQWTDIFDANVTGTFNITQAATPALKAANRGAIIIISSGAGLTVSLTGIQAYAAQIGLTRQLAHELGAFNITVNSIAPGFIRSNPTTEKQWEALGAVGQERLVNSFALRRLGSPDDIANAALFLASDQGSWITGQTLSVDGGRL